MADNASAPENPPHGSAKDSVPDPGLPTPAASLGPDEERNKADQQRREAESSKATGEGVVPTDAGRTKASEQGDALPNQGTTRSAEQGVASVNTSQATTESAGQGVASVNTSQATTESAGQGAVAGKNNPEASKPKENNDAGPSQKAAVERPTRIGKSKNRKQINDKDRQQTIDRVLRCDPADGFKMFNVTPDTEKAQIEKAIVRLLFRTSPKRLSDPDQKTLKHTEDAHERVKKAYELLQQQLNFPPMDEDKIEDKIEEEDDGDAMDGIESTEREEFFQQIYLSTEDLLADLSKKPDDIGIIAKLESVNHEINKRNDLDKTEGGVIDYRAISRLFALRNALHGRLQQDPPDEKCEKQLNEVAEDFAQLVRDNGYPGKWVDLLKLTELSGYGAKSKASESSKVQAASKSSEVQAASKSSEVQAASKSRGVQAGQTLKGEPILGCRKVLGGYRYYVECLVNNRPTCVVQTAGEIGRRTSDAYLNWDQCVTVGEDARKYRRKDVGMVQGIIHVACKPAYTRTLPKDPSRKSRRPLTDVYVLFNGEKVWMTFSDLVCMQGKTDTEFDMERYYNQRGMQYPWDVPAKRIITVQETPSYQKVANASTTLVPSTPTPENRSDQEAQTANDRDNDIAALRKDNEDMRKQLASLSGILQRLTASLEEKSE